MTPAVQFRVEQRRKWSPTANDLQIGPQMIPNHANDPWYGPQKILPKTKNGMEFGSLDVIIIFLIYFHQLNDELHQIKGNIQWQCKV